MNNSLREGWAVLGMARNSTYENLRWLKRTLPSIEGMAQNIESCAAPLGWIHGLQWILKNAGYYRWKIDGRMIANNRVWEKRANLVEALMWFQVGYSLMNQNHTWGTHNWIPKEEIGNLGPQTLGALLDFAHKRNLVLPPKCKWDKPFLTGNNFIQQYGPMIGDLTRKLWLPNNLLLGIAQQESCLGTNPADYQWWNGIMQLTAAPFDDMSGQTQSGVTDWAKIQIYQWLFRKINISQLRKLAFWSTTLESSIGAEIWKVLDTICSADTNPQDFRVAIWTIKSWERGLFRWLTFHTVNILIGAVYLAYINSYKLKSSGNIAQIAKHYNGSPQKNIYAASVQKHVQMFAMRESWPDMNLSA